jgi:hypothetical protein
MLNLQRVKKDYCTEKLRDGYKRTYSELEHNLGNIIVWATHLALENIANSDALYHDMDHTVLATLAGQAIIEGKHLSEGGVRPKDWAHFIIALLCHDIGYVKGICSADSEQEFATGIDGRSIRLPKGCTDAMLAPYHIDRSKLFVLERFGHGILEETGQAIDAEQIASFIEMTRFPVPDDDWYKDTAGLGGLVRAADFIGQLADPNRLQKCTALFYEFEEIGLNEKLGYQKPGDLRDCNAKFYWKVVNPYVQDALKYLRATQDGKQWIANLQANVFGQDLFSVAEGSDRENHL